MKKNILLIILILIINLLVLSSCGKGYSKGLEYKINELNTYSVTGIGTCTDVNIVIPNKYKGLPVTCIGSQAFIGSRNLESITIPNSVTSIGSSAFHGCGLEEVIFEPNSQLMRIGADAFRDCYHLESIEVPNGVSSIEENTFYNSGLTKITIPNSVTSIGKAAFYRCSYLEEVVFESNCMLINIGEFAFADCASLVEMVIPQGVIEIEQGAFILCTNLEKIVIPNSVEIIEDCFNRCDKLTIYCEVASMPTSWSDGWNPDKFPVVWGYKG